MARTTKPIKIRPIGKSKDPYAPPKHGHGDHQEKHIHNESQAHHGAHAEPESGGQHHGAHHASKSDEDSLRDLIRKYISIFPFIRKKELAETLVSPDSAMQREMHAASVKQGYLDYIIPAYFLAVPVLLIYAFFIAVFSGGMGLPVAALILFGGLLILPVAIFIAQLISTLVLFISAKLFGGKGGFGKMMGMYGTIAGAVMLLNLPLALLSFIPCIGYLFQIIGSLLLVYQLYLLYKLNVHLHGLSTTKAVLAIVLPCVLLMLLIVVAVALWFMAVLAMASAGALGGQAF